ncbi:MAG: PaaI family thioesterase [Beijerinckiaceae bacterium]
MPETSNVFDLAAARHLLRDVFAPWIQALDLTVEKIEGSIATLRLPVSPALAREGGIICGQALMAAADTAFVFAVSAASGRYRPMTTVDQTTHFLKPAVGADILVIAEVTRLGKGMAFGRVDLVSTKDNKPVALVQTAYALLGE